MTLLNRLRLTRNSSSLKWIGACPRPVVVPRLAPALGELPCLRAYSTNQIIQLTGYIGLELANLCIECSQPCLCHFHIMRIMAATDTNTPNNTHISLDRVAAAEDDQAIGFDNTMQQRLVILHKVEPLVCCHTKPNSGVSLVLRDFYAQKPCSVHTAEIFEHA